MLENINLNQIKEEATPKLVDQLISSIYTKEKTENTDELVKAAKLAWDSLTEEEKTQVKEGDYFGFDTGDATSDNPLSHRPTRDKEILVASFGTSFNDNRLKTIGAIEKAIKSKYGEEYDIRRAFTSRIIINHIASRDGIRINDIKESMELAKQAGVKEMVVQPTHMLMGSEYDDLVEDVINNKDNIKIVFGEPLLGDIGKDENDINKDKEEVMKIMTEATAKGAGKDSFKELIDDTAVIFMGHGTSHEAMITYIQMQTVAENLGYSNVIIGTVDGEPIETSLENVMSNLKEKGFKKVILRPMMVVAGDHANNDMAGEQETSWKKVMEREGFDVQCQLQGLGELKDIHDIYIKHIDDALN